MSRVCYRAEYGYTSLIIKLNQSITYIVYVSGLLIINCLLGWIRLRGTVEAF